MAYLFERRQNWHRIVGLERRGAPFRTLMGHPLPDPTQLVDEDFQAEQLRRLESRARAPKPWRPGRKEP